MSKEHSVIQSLELDNICFVTFNFHVFQNVNQSIFVINFEINIYVNVDT